LDKYVQIPRLAETALTKSLLREGWPLEAQYRNAALVEEFQQFTETPNQVKHGLTIFQRVPFEGVELTTFNVAWD
jgi:hypothetical protein